MRFIFVTLTLLAFIPSSWAEITACWNTAPTCSSTACNCPAGCKPAPSNVTNPAPPGAQTSAFSNQTVFCTPCPNGKYGENCNETCPRVNPSNATPTWLSHQYWDSTHDNPIRGARTIYECYQNIDGGCSIIHATSPHNATGTQGNCRKYYRDDGFFVSCSSETQNSDWNHNPDTNADTGAPLNTEQDLTDEQLTTHYHMDSDDQCRQNKYSCKQMGFKNTNSVYYDWCIREDFAYWRTRTGGGWDVAGCGYKPTYNYSSASYPYQDENRNVVSTFRDNPVHAPYLGTVNGTEVNCYATVEVHLAAKIADDNTSLPDNDVLSNRFEYSGDNSTLELFRGNNFERIYLDKAGQRPGYIKRYYCLGCKSGYVPADYPPGFDDYKSSPSETFGSCKKADNGYYSTGCSRANRAMLLNGGMGNSTSNPSCRWWCSSFFDNGTNCETEVDDTYYHGIPCFAGMTSPAGSTSKTQCRYTNETQFCDAYGCFKFDELQQTSPYNKYHSGDLTWTFSHSYR